MFLDRIGSRVLLVRRNIQWTFCGCALMCYACLAPKHLPDYAARKSSARVLNSLPYRVKGSGQPPSLSKCRDGQGDDQGELVRFRDGTWKVLQSLGIGYMDVPVRRY